MSSDILSVTAGKSQDDVDVKGTTVHTYTLSETDSFGESGDVFEHRSWRRAFAALWRVESARRLLLSLCTNIMLRGKSFKTENRGKTLSIILPLNGDLPDEVKVILDPRKIGVKTFKMNVVCPTADSRVPGLALTPERMKCLFRTVGVWQLIKEKKLPATSEAIGYGDMCRSFIIYKDWEMDVKLQREDPQGKMIQPHYSIWKSFLNNVEGNGEIIARMVTLSMVAGCFSSKEVYLEDEQIYTGCIWWSGIHALMTDVSNKVRAKHAQQDVRPRLENSNFYGDFKRKMAARNITLVFNENYYLFLENMKEIIGKFLLAKSGVSDRESKVIDELILSSANKKSDVALVTRTSGTGDDAVKEIAGEFSLGSLPSTASQESFVTKLTDAMEGVGLYPTKTEIEEYNALTKEQLATLESQKPAE